MDKLNLYLGDCLEVMKDIPDKCVDLILCDPPFGTTRNKWDSVIDLDLMWKEYNRIIKDNGVILLFAQTPFDKVLGVSNIKNLKYEWIWRKPQGTGHLNAKKMPLKNHENILVFYSCPPPYHPQFREGKPYTCKSGRGSSNYGEQVSVVTVNDGKRYPVDVLDFNKDKCKLHPTQKPVALLEYFIKTYTSEGDVVMDNCMGSGSTGVAALKNNRKFIGIEKDENYFNIAKERITNEIK